ncbi:putative nuclear RNA export factor SDE5 isoform X2 [Quercus robur]|uniref:putative nuclear RNA export factor SDE5 isoform X2 n=1 Tax=Quercus robur TaxID=38942 RepID=UPI002161FE12|nr:putative nuclear RNA export factor SDE5 isoform X2 [Quercus robur]
MEASGSNEPKYDDEEQVLKGLLDAFGPTFSLDDIATAFCKAGRNADLAGEILYDMQGSTSSAATNASNGEAKGEESPKSSCGNFSEKSDKATGRNSRASKPKTRPVCAGMVSSILGKDYIKSTPPVNGSYMVRKPLKLDSKVMPMSELWEVESKSCSPKYDHLHQEMEDFLFKMLGDGFQLDRDVIRQVLDNCGFDMQQSMEKLLDLAAVTVGKKNNFVGECTEKFIFQFRDVSPEVEVLSHQRKLQNGNRVSSTNGIEPPGQLRERNDLQKEVLVALFNAPERSNKLVGRTTNVAKRSATSWRLVDGPPMDFLVDHKKTVTYLRRDHEDDVDEEENYQILRKAVKEYRGVMKEYYTAAVDAFAEGDHVRAEKLLEQGHFFHKKVREADEESSKKILESRNVDSQDEILLDLHDHGAKEALRLLKCHISSFSRIPSIKDLKVIIETNDEDITKGSRRRQVLKLLERESIKWTEEGNAGVILIHLDNINRKQLSFVKK